MRLFFFATALIFLGSAAAAQSPPTSSPKASAGTSGAEQEIISAARARANALAASDCPKWNSYVDSDFRNIENSGSTSREAALKECHNLNANGHRQERVVSDFHFKFIANLALVDYHYQVIDHFGDLTFHDAAHQVETFENRGGKWIALLAVSVPIFEDPPPAKLDPATLDAFTGQYAWTGAPNMIDTVTRNGGKLYIQTTGDEAPNELIPLGADTFAVHASHDRVTFLRDKDGRVIEEHDHSPNGEDVHAKKIK